MYELHRCATCHDPAQSKLGISVKPLDHLAERYDLNALEALLAAPPSPMPSYPLTAEEKRALAVYLLSKIHTSGR